MNEDEIQGYYSACMYNKEVFPKRSLTENGKYKWENSRASKQTRYLNYNRSKHSPSLREKERWSIELIKMSIRRASNPVISCSFGIDSIVAIFLTRKALVEMGREPSDIDIVWNDTKNEFHDVRQYAKEMVEKWGLRLVVTSPKKMLKTIIEENGGVTTDYFFTRKGDRRKGRPLSEKCCSTLKHEPMHRATKENKWDLILNGLRADESRQRMQAGLRDGEFFYSHAEWKAYVCRPILWWTEEDIWEYVRREKIPYNHLYENNLIMEYPPDIAKIISSGEIFQEDLSLDISTLREQQTQSVDRWDANILQKYGFKMFTPRTGCQMCPIPIKYGYLQWMRIYYPKVYNGMVHNLGYGKVLLEMIPEEVKEEIRLLTGVDISAENAHEFLKEILEAKPCTFDKF